VCFPELFDKSSIEFKQAAQIIWGKASKELEDVSNKVLKWLLRCRKMICWNSIKWKRHGVLWRVQIPAPPPCTFDKFNNLQT